MENLAENNKFIELFEDLYDSLYMNKQPVTNQNSLDNIMDDINKESKQKRKFKLFSKIVKLFSKIAEDPEEEKIREILELDHEKEMTYINSDLCTKYSYIKKYIDDLISLPAQDFWTLWRYCQFVRWADKVLMFKNDPKESPDCIYVDSEMCDDTREFFFTYNGVSIFVKLELIQKPYVKIAESAYNEVLTLVIKRPYGKKMENKITVINGELDFSDDSDVYMVNEINRMLNASIQTTTQRIIESMIPDNILQHFPAFYTSSGYYKVRL